MAPAGPPKSQNELTRIIGKLKRFGSKNFRKTLSDPSANIVLKRKIGITSNALAC